MVALEEKLIKVITDQPDMNVSTVLMLIHPIVVEKFH